MGRRFHREPFSEVTRIRPPFPPVGGGPDRGRARSTNPLLRRFLDGKRPIIVASHPRSGTHLTIDLLRRHFPACDAWKLPGERLDRLYVNLDVVLSGELHERFAATTLFRAARPIFKSHAYPGFLRSVDQRLLDCSNPWWPTLARSRGDFVYAVRDGRAVMCSYHLFMKGEPSASDCSLSAFLRQRVDGKTRVAIWAEHVRAWLDAPNVVAVRFEDLTRDSEATIVSLGRSLGLEPRLVSPLLPELRPNTLRYRIERRLRIRPASTAVHGRSVGHTLEKWWDAFTEADREHFHREAGDVLTRLGYEQSDQWVTRVRRPAPLTHVVSEMDGEELETTGT